MRLTLAIALALCSALPANAALLPHGSFEECNGDDCIFCLWECYASTDCNWIVAPQNWGIDAFDGVLAGWLGGWCGEDSEINQNSFCLEIPAIQFARIDWWWTAWVNEGYDGNVIRATLDGEVVYEHTLAYPEDHTWGDWQVAYTINLDPWCQQSDLMFCIEILPTTGASYFVDYFWGAGACGITATEAESFSMIKSYYR